MVPNTEKISSLVHQLLIELGEDPGREGLLKTPTRVAAALEYLTSGARTDPQRVINDAIFTQETNSMVIVKNIEVYSLCEHHLLPFFGRCHIGYIPSGKVFGLSKLARLVDVYARRLQTPGTPHRADLAGSDGFDRRARRRRHDRSAPPVHDDARRGKTEFGDGYLVRCRDFPRLGCDPRGVFGAGRESKQLGKL